MPTIGHYKLNLISTHCKRSFASQTCQVYHRLPGHPRLSRDQHRRVYALCTLTTVRFNSSQTSDPAEITIPDFIPPPPSIPVPDITDITDIASTLNALGEPTFASLGLGGLSPIGVVQSGLEMLHVGCGLPWWSAIVVGTIFLRICVFPLVVLAQKNAIHMQNHTPTMTRLQERFTEARQSGNALHAARSGQEFMDYMKRNNIKPFKNFLVPLAQFPIFVSVFVGVRKMANLPVESLSTGGILWFTNLTIPDPFYILPIMTMLTFLATVEVGVDGLKSSAMGHIMKWFLRILPVIMLPFISNFPTVMLCYWFTSNAFSLMQVLFLKIPKVRDFFKIPVAVKHDLSAMPKKKKFIEGFRDSMNNAKLARVMEDRQRVDAVKFKEAGTGPIQKTYSYDPTKKPAQISAKTK